ncbi:MAG: glycosyltransferase family 4 protein [Bacteroidales bacterium]|nr:glycosyltransferase family 4 protein [Bacteroidales bacterium]
MKIAFLTNIPSPFMIDLQNELNKNFPVEYYIFACKPCIEHRGKHWENYPRDEGKVKIYNNTEKIDIWIIKQIEWSSPDIIITVFNHGIIFNTLIKYKTILNYKVVKWNEKPPYKNFVYSFLRKCYHSFLWRNKVDYILAIGYGALDTFKKYFFISSLHIILFPYYQKVSENHKSPYNPSKIRFLFSGRLIKRNNIKLLLKAFHKLAQNHSDKFSWTISAKGDLLKMVDKCIKKSPLKNHIHFDEGFVNWDDRLNSFLNSDVLVVPAKYSGWGLVINEALSLGLPVITTKTMEASKYLVEHMINGVIIKQTVTELYNALEYFIKYPKEIERLSKNAKEINNRYNLELGANHLYNFFQNIVN